MPAVYEVKFVPAGLVLRLSQLKDNYYLFDDQTRLTMDTTPIWCHRCGKVGHGEDIETVAEIDKRLTSLHDPTSEVCRRFENTLPKDMFRLAMIEEARVRRQWREQRRSGPKCIDCGSTEISPLRIKGSVPHPAGEGTIEIKVVGIYSGQSIKRFFTPEGDSI